MSLLYPAPTPIDPRNRASHPTYRRYTTTRASFGECTGPRPAAYKILRQPSADPTRASLCAHTASPCVFAHIRAASPGSAVAAINNHPFIFGRHAFMHNGGVAHFPLIRRRLSNSYWNCCFPLGNIWIYVPFGFVVHCNQHRQCCCAYGWRCA